MAMLLAWALSQRELCPRIWLYVVGCCLRPEVPKPTTHHKHKVDAHVRSWLSVYEATVLYYTFIIEKRSKKASETIFGLVHQLGKLASQQTKSS